VGFSDDGACPVGWGLLPTTPPALPTEEDCGGGCGCVAAVLPWCGDTFPIVGSAAMDGDGAPGGSACGGCVDGCWAAAVATAVTAG